MIYKQRSFELLGHIFATNAEHVIFLNFRAACKANKAISIPRKHLLTCLRVQSTMINSTYAYHVNIAGTRGLEALTRMLFSGHRLVCVRRVRPGNEINENGEWFFCKGKRKP